jgi:hypothetical protein
MRSSSAGTLDLVVLVLLSSPSASLANRANISPQELAKAINEASPQSVPYRAKRTSAADIRDVRCVGSDEEPTEFQCTWRQHTNIGWIKRRTGLAIDGNGWRVID